MDKRVLLALAIIPALLIAMGVAVYAQELEKTVRAENVTITLNPDGSIGIIGNITAVSTFSKPTNITGTGYIAVNATPIKAQAGYDWNIIVYGKGDFKIKSEIDHIKGFSLTINEQGKGVNDTATVRFSLTTVNVSGVGDAIFKTKSVGNYTVSLSISFDVNFKAKIKPEEAAQIQKQLQMMNPTILNLAFTQQGLTFLKFQKLDLSNLKVTENGIKGNGEVVILVNYKDYLEFYRQMLAKQGMNETAIKSKIAALEKILNAELSGKGSRAVVLTVTLSNGEIKYLVKAEVTIPAEIIQGYQALFGQAATGVKFATLPSEIKAKISEALNETPVNFSSLRLTIAPKPQYLRAELQASEYMVRLSMQTNLYLKGINVTNDYNGALQSLKNLASALKPNQTISHVVIEVVPSKGVCPAPEVKGKTIGKAVVIGNKIMLENAKPSDLELVSVNTSKLIKVTTTTTTTPTKTTTTSKTTTTTTTTTASKTTTTSPSTTTTPSPTTTAKKISTGVTIGIAIVIVVIAIVAIAVTRKGAGK